MSGRGSSDMKSGLAAAMVAFRNIAKTGKKPKHTFYCIASVDEEALIEALRTGEIAGAGLDVLTAEGIDKDAPLQKFDNVIITPHAAWYSEEAFNTLLTSAAQEVVRALHGKPVKNQVNKF